MPPTDTDTLCHGGAPTGSESGEDEGRHEVGARVAATVPLHGGSGTAMRVWEVTIPGSILTSTVLKERE